MLPAFRATVLTAVNDLTRRWTARLAPSDRNAQAGRMLAFDENSYVGTGVRTSGYQGAVDQHWMKVSYPA
jgi:hypothetical protein